MVKIPAFQFYPADWLNDIKLQSCSLAAQGLLINLMCIMHQSEPYGKLMINGHKPSIKDVSHLLRLHHKTYQARLKELLLYGVLYEDENGVVCNKRMIKDEHIRQVRRDAGKLGGNPLLKQKDKQDSKQKSTPSSSVSSSPSNSILPKGNNADLKICPHKKIIDLYHNVLPELPKIVDWNKTLEGYLKSRWREQPERQNLKWWEKFFIDEIKTSDFLMGRVNDFQVNLGWIVKPTNFSKILNGQYKNRKNSDPPHRGPKEITFDNVAELERN